MEEKPKEKPGQGPFWGIIVLVLVIVLTDSLGGQKENISSRTSGGTYSQQSTAATENKYEKTYSIGGLSITVPSYFERTNDPNTVGTLVSDNAGIGWTKTAYADLYAQGIDPDDYTLKDWIDVVEWTGDWENWNVQYDGAIPFATHDAGDFRYCKFVYQGSDGIWLVGFWSYKKDFNDLRPLFIKWARTVEVT